jgi:hypothetical protein
MKSIFILSGLLGAATFAYCAPFAKKAANPAAAEAPICNAGHVTKLQVAEGADEGDLETISWTLSNGAKFNLTPGYMNNRDGYLAFEQPGPSAMLQLLTASYINQKPICYTQNSAGVVTSVSFE